MTKSAVETSSAKSPSRLLLLSADSARTVTATEKSDTATDPMTQPRLGSGSDEIWEFAENKDFSALK